MKLPSIICIAALLAFHSCTDSQKENSLKTREQELIIKEKEFEAKEAEFQELIAMRDSLKNANDSAIANNSLPLNILGKWNGKMICTESTCPEHVIGDQRNDVWEFTPQGLKMTNKTGGERLFTAKISGDDLIFSSEPSSNLNNSSQITFKLNSFQDGKIKGSRDFTGNNGCVAKFSVELEKNQK